MSVAERWRGDANSIGQFQLTLAGSSAVRTRIDLPSGESTNVTMTSDTGTLDTGAIGESKLKATSINDENAEMVTIEAPTPVLEPTVEDVGPDRGG